MDISVRAKEMILAEMKNKNIRVYQLAKLSGVDQGNTHRFFHRQHKIFRPSLDTISKYFKVLGLTLDSLEKQEAPTAEVEQ